ncbi:P-II family nitrogen regulator [Methanomicrobium antiquum]|uniref:P-II family nitrogen regulator n=1 Tax=Methanomicrobium antiquum TaxID=487686 RepID=A0AAF0JLC8_9EURY|nr:P-II family nitrogen regulator [Methanomicrobium antiquum]MDD3976732.1 P-II family nitrogen regulator [Methanomicrobium sp.]WFN36519.1 P-II family nitrogen regulator [Methanomicrobium antiquum]
MDYEGSQNLIVTIVKKGWAERVIKASKSAGAEGGTILMGRGTGINEKQSVFGLPIEPEKEIVLTIIDAGQTDAILSAIESAAKLNIPGMGIAFVVNLEKIAGRVHMFSKYPEEEKN